MNGLYFLAYFGGCAAIIAGGEYMRHRALRRQVFRDLTYGVDDQ